jgi:HSP20 family molecular chaperone IbpA
MRRQALAVKCERQVARNPFCVRKAEFKNGVLQVIIPISEAKRKRGAVRLAVSDFP